MQVEQSVCRLLLNMCVWGPVQSLLSWSGSSSRAQRSEEENRPGGGWKGLERPDTPSNTGSHSSSAGVGLGEEERREGWRGGWMDGGVGGGVVEGCGERGGDGGERGWGEERWKTRRGGGGAVLSWLTV